MTDEQTEKVTYTGGCPLKTSAVKIWRSKILYGNLDTCFGFCDVWNGNDNQWIKRYITCHKTIFDLWNP